MRAGHDVTVVCQERHPERYDLGGARVVVPELPDGLLPVFVLDDYEGLEARLLQDFTRAQREAYVQANAAALRALAARRRRLREPRAARRAGRARERRALRREGARLGARVLDARASRARALGRRVARAAQRRCSSAPSTSAPCSRTSSVTSTACTRCRRGLTWTSSCRKKRDGGARGVDRRRRAATRPTATSAIRMRGTRSASPSSSPTDAPTIVFVGKLIENKGVQVLFDAMRDLDARAVDRRLRRLPGRARGARARAGALHGSARAPAPRAPAAARRRLGRARRSSPRRSGWSPPRPPPPACRRSSPTTPGSPRWRRASPPSIRRRSPGSTSFPSGDAAALADGCASCSRCRSGAAARPRGAPRRRAQLELDAGRRAAARATSIGIGFRRWATSRRSATRSCSPPPRPGSRRFPTSPSRSRRSSRCSIPRRSASSAASRRCSRRRSAPTSSRTSWAS